MRINITDTDCNDPVTAYRPTNICAAMVVQEIHFVITEINSALSCFNDLKQKSKLS